MPTKVEPKNKAAAPKKRRNFEAPAETESASPRMTGGRTVPAPTIPPTPCFQYVVNVQRWDVIGGRVVPVVSTLEFRAGIGGVDIDRNGAVNIGTAAATAQATGRIIIPHNVDGPGTSYVRRLKSNGGWISKWETQFAGSDVREVDSEGFATWLRSLIDRDIIPGPAPHILTALAETLQARIDTYNKSKAGPEGYKAKIAQTQKDLDVVRAELERISDELVESEVEDAAPPATV